MQSHSSITPLVPLVLGGCLALAPDAVEPFAPHNLAKAEPLSRSLLNFRQDQSPSPSFIPREFDFRAPVPSLPSPNFESYLVYVNEANSTRLQQVQQLEPTAFVRQYKGHSVIQAGVFNQKDHAQQLARALESRGIEAQIVSLSK